MAESYGRASLPARDYLKSMRGVKRIYALPGSDPGRRAEFLDHARYNSYFVWLQKSLQRIYNLGEELTLENWDQLSARIAEGPTGGQAHLDILRRQPGYRAL